MSSMRGRVSTRKALPAWVVVVVIVVVIAIVAVLGSRAFRPKKGLAQTPELKRIQQEMFERMRAAGGPKGPMAQRLRARAMRGQQEK